MTARTPTLFLMVGLPGSGKTTLAKELERQRPALRLTPDEWMAPLGFDPYGAPEREKVESLQWRVAERALALGVDVVLDFGFWGRSERDDFRARARSLGANCVVRFLDVTRAELLARLERRNAALPPDTYQIEASLLDSHIRMFEPPSADELA